MSKKRQAETAAALASATRKPKPSAKAKPAAKSPPAQKTRRRAIPAVAEPAGPTDIVASAAAQPAPIAEQRGLVAAAAIAYRETLTIGQVFASPLNPRRRIAEDGLDSLALSIAQKGLLQPLLCRPAEWDSDKGPFDGVTSAELILGARRRIAIERAIAGIADADGVIWRLPADYRIPLRLRHPTSDRDLRILAATENFDREDMNPLDEAELFDSLRDDVEATPGKTPEAAIAALFPKISERTVFRRRALLRCTEAVQEALRDRKITLQQAEAFSIGKPEDQDAVLREFLGGDRSYTAALEIRQALSEELIAVEASGIDPALYDGEIIEDEEEDERYFADTAQVRRLRRDAIEAKAAELRARWPWVEILAEDAVNRVHFEFVQYEVAADDPEAGAILWRQNWPPFDIIVRAPILRSATVAARQQAERGGAIAEGGAANGSPAKPARPALSQMQIQRLHEAKTKALRRALAEPVASERKKDSLKHRVPLALAILGLGGAHEVRHMAARSGFGYEPALGRIPPVVSAEPEQDRLAHLIQTAAVAMHPRDKAGIKGRETSELGLSQNGYDSANVAAWFWALLELPDQDLTELFARLLAERVGSWVMGPDYGGGRNGHDAQCGDSELAVAIATATGAEAYLPELWHPDVEWFKAYGRDRLVAIVRDVLGIKNADKYKKGQLAELCAEQPKGFWTPDKFPECRFQLEADAAMALSLSRPPGEGAAGETPAAAEAAK